jgi:ketosteroid isomerase-like protein
MDEKKVIEQTIHQAFNVGKNKELSLIHSIHLNNEQFSKFSDIPPYHLQGYEEACLHEEMFFANVSDYDFKIKDLKIEIFNDIAITAFILEEQGMIVDDYSFTGRTLNVKARVSMIFKKYGDKWLIIHEHLSRIPEH